MSDRPRVVIVDDHHLFRAGVRAELAALVRAIVGTDASLVLVGVLLLHVASDRALLGDGTAVAHGFALPELMRVAFVAKGTFTVKLAFVTLFLGAAILTGAFPVHVWLAEATAEAEKEDDGGCSVVRRGALPDYGVVALSVSAIVAVAALLRRRACSSRPS